MRRSGPFLALLAAGTLLASTELAAGGGFGAAGGIGPATGLHVGSLGAGGFHAGFGGLHTVRGPYVGQNIPAITHAQRPAGHSSATPSVGRVSANPGFASHHLTVAPSQTASTAATTGWSVHFPPSPFAPNGIFNLPANATVRGPIINPIIYGWPFGPGGVGWGGPLWWALGYPGWRIYDRHPAGYPPISSEQAQMAADSIAQGGRAFRAGKYEDAVRCWYHALIDDPSHAEVLLLISQAWFALGKFEAAAGNVQLAMEMLPDTRWGSVVKGFSQLYPSVSTYSDQLAALEKARDTNPWNPALRFLAAYHYGYLGYRDRALFELDQVLQIEPRDAAARWLRSVFAAQLDPARPARLPSRPQPVSQATLDAVGLGNAELLTDAEGHYVRGLGATSGARR